MVEPVKRATIVFLTHSGADSGAEQSIVTYLSRWPRAEKRPLLLLGGHGAIEARAEASGLEMMTLELDPGAGSTNRQERSIGRLAGAVTGLLRHASKVRRVLRERSADIVVAISLKSLVFGWLAGRRAGAKVVWSLHDRVDRGYFSWFLVPVLRYLVPRMVDGIMVNSYSTLATIRPGKTPVVVATPAIALDPRDFGDAGDEVRRVVMLARLSPWKGQDVFLRAFARAFDGSPAEAYIVGGALFGETSTSRSLHQLAEDLGHRRPGALRRARRRPMGLAGGRGRPGARLAIPEPFGQVVVQGLWARSAVVASRPGGPAEVITDGNDGLLTPAATRTRSPAPSGACAATTTSRSLAPHGRETARNYDAAIAAPVLDAWLANLHMGAVEPRSVRGVFPQRADSHGAARTDGDRPSSGPTTRVARAGTLLVRAAASASVRPARAIFRVMVSRPMASRGASTAATTALIGSSVSDT